MELKISKRLCTATLAALIVAMHSADVSAYNLYLNNMLNQSTPQQLTYFSMNALHYCKKTINIETCLKSLSVAQTKQLFTNPQHTYVSCLKVNEYCDPKVIFGAQCCPGLVCTGAAPFYNVSTCKA